MSHSAKDLEGLIRAAGAVYEEPFTGVSGRQMFTRVEWEVVDQNPELTSIVAGVLAVKMEIYKPQLIVAVPTGGDVLGMAVASELEIDCLHMNWVNKAASYELEFVDDMDETTAQEATTIGLIDDVFTTGRTLSRVTKTRGVAGKVVIAGVGWDRSDSALPKKLGFPLMAAVERCLR